MMPQNRDNPRFPGLPTAASYELFECGDPKCGPHIVALNDSGAPICEIVFSPKGALEIIKNFQKMLYGKATEQ